MKTLKWNMVILSAVYAALGLVLLFWPDKVLGGICILIGWLVAGTGIVQTVRFFIARDRLFFAPLTLLTGLVSLGLGLFLLLRSDIILTALPLVFGLFVVFDSVGRIQNALELRRCGMSSWKGIFAMGLVSVVLGLVVLFNPFGTLQALAMGIGIILIVEGVLNLLSMGYTALMVKQVEKARDDYEDAVEDVFDALEDAVNQADSSSDTIEGTAREINLDDTDTGR